jgi:hypothetical protein
VARPVHACVRSRDRKQCNLSPGSDVEKSANFRHSAFNVAGISLYVFLRMVCVEPGDLDRPGHRISWLIVLWFSPIPPGKCRVDISNRPRSFPSRCFIIHHSSYHLTSYSLRCLPLRKFSCDVGKKEPEEPDSIFFRFFCSFFLSYFLSFNLFLRLVRLLFLHPFLLFLSFCISN